MLVVKSAIYQYSTYYPQLKKGAIWLKMGSVEVLCSSVSMSRYLVLTSAKVWTKKFPINKSECNLLCSKVLMPQLYYESNDHPLSTIHMLPLSFSMPSSSLILITAKSCWFDAWSGI